MDILDMSCSELRKYASKIGIKKLRGMKKNDIINAIKELELSVITKRKKCPRINLYMCDKPKLYDIAKEMNIIIKGKTKQDLIEDITTKNKILKFYMIEEIFIMDVDLEKIPYKKLKAITPNTIGGKSECNTKEKLVEYSKQYRINNNSSPSSYDDLTKEYEKLMDQETPLKDFPDKLIVLHAKYLSVDNVYDKSIDQLIKECNEVYPMD